jgi:4-amino-4-deoxy-L-arabinose transferase-like glycosyltransferase
VIILKIGKVFNRKFTLVVVLLIAAGLRVEKIDQPYIGSFAWREASTAMMADNFHKGNWNIFYPEVSWGGAGPNYQGREFQTTTYLAALIYKVFGKQEWIGRGIALVFGVWGIYALYQLIRGVWDEERALAGAAVMALLPGSILIERSFLPDPVMVSLVTTSLWMLVAYCQTERIHYLLLAVVIGTLGFLTKLPGLIVGLPALYVIITMLGPKLRQRAMWTRLIAAGLLILLPVAGYYLWARHLALSYPPHHFAGSGKWLWDEGIAAWMDKNYFLPGLWEVISTTLWTVPFCILVVIGIFSRPPGLQHHSPSTDSPEEAKITAPWFFHWWLVAMAIYYFIGANELVVNKWNLHLVNPVAAAFAGQAVVLTARFLSACISKRATIAILVSMLISFYAMGRVISANSYQPHYKSDRSLGIALKNISSKNDLIVSFGLRPISLYYSQRQGWVFPPAEVWSNHEGQYWDWGEKDIQLLDSLRARGAKWLMIPVNNNYFYWGGDSYLSEHFPLLAIYILNTCESKLETPEGMICRLKSQSSQKPSGPGSLL